jgi:hypothetical protein
MGVGGFLVDASLDHKIRVSGFMSIKTSTASRLFDSQADANNGRGVSGNSG